MKTAFTKQEHIFSLFFLFCLLLMGGGLFLLFQHLFLDTSNWHKYVRVYTIFMICFVWYATALLLLSDLRRKNYPLRSTPMTVIIPCYNEDPELLRRCVSSIYNADGVKEIILGNDGSTRAGLAEVIDDLAKTYSLKVFHFPTNRGKRHVLSHAIKMATYPIIVTTDSDTLIGQHSLLRLTAPLAYKKIGATTGDVLLLNEKQNLLTRMIGAYYWIGLNIYKVGQSALGLVVCCSGCLAAYRKDALLPILDKFTNQKFFGEECTHSEDRHLTNLILERGYSVQYVRGAKCYTETPATLKGFLRQQLRWKRGFFRESLYTLSYAWKRSKILFFETLMWNLFVTFLSFGIRVAVVLTAFVDPLFFLRVIVPSWVLFMIIRNLFLFTEAPQKGLAFFPYMFLYEFVMYWMNIYALFTMTNKSWMTRQAPGA